jgi:hypothetical protein
MKALEFGYSQGLVIGLHLSEERVTGLSVAGTSFQGCSRALAKLKVKTERLFSR